MGRGSYIKGTISVDLFLPKRGSTLVLCAYFYLAVKVLRSVIYIHNITSGSLQAIRLPYCTVYRYCFTYIYSYLYVFCFCATNNI